MPRGPPLNDDERLEILRLKQSGKSLGFISKQLNRSKKVIFTFLKAPDDYNKKKSTGRPRKLSDRESL